MARDNISAIAPVARAAPPIVLSNQSRIALREASKIDRRTFTDAIQAFTGYVDSEGNVSTAPERAYSNFTRTVYAAFGLNKKQREALMNGEPKSRDIFSLRDLRFLQMAESTAASIIFEGIEAAVSRKAIKEAVKAECEAIGLAHKRIADGVFKGAAQ